MWTDGRYYLQARAQMDDNWLLMKDGRFSTLCCSFDISWHRAFCKFIVLLSLLCDFHNVFMLVYRAS